MFEDIQIKTATDGEGQFKKPDLNQSVKIRVSLDVFLNDQKSISTVNLLSIFIFSLSLSLTYT